MNNFRFSFFWLTFTVSMATITFVSYGQNDQNDQPAGLSITINGVKWALGNVNTPGTFAENPEDAGMFYQWNRKVAWSFTDLPINSEGGTIWDETIPTGSAWVKANDPCPAGWRLPTLDDIEKLLNKEKVSNAWTAVNGINGRRFFDNATGNSIFLPAAGYLHHSDGTLRHVGMLGYYWSSSMYDSDQAYTLYFFSNAVSNSNSSRVGGFSVRCVAE